MKVITPDGYPSSSFKVTGMFFDDDERGPYPIIEFETTE